MAVSHMEVKERFIAGKTNDERDCEDEIVINDHFVAVLDGATSQIASEQGELSPGKKAVNQIAAELHALNGDVSMRECFYRINNAVAQIYLDEGIYEKAREKPEYRSSASAIVFSRFHSEIWSIGDCQALVDDRHITSWKSLENTLAETRALFLESELERGKTINELRAEDTGRLFIRELLVRQKLFQNRKSKHVHGYYVIDGFLESIEEAVEVYPVSKNTKSIVLSTDGYPSLRGTLRESEDFLRELLIRDPLCFREFKATKGVYSGNRSFDDRAYVRLELDPSFTTYTMERGQ